MSDIVSDWPETKLGGGSEVSQSAGWHHMACDAHNNILPVDVQKYMNQWTGKPNGDHLTGSPGKRP